MNCLRTVVQVSNSLRAISKQHLELPAYKAKAKYGAVLQYYNALYIICLSMVPSLKKISMEDHFQGNCLI